MKNYLTLTLIFLVTIPLFSQYKLNYEYTYQYDSKDPTSIIKENVTVIKSQNERFYFEENQINKIEVDYLAKINNEDPQLTWEKQGNIPYSKLYNFLIESNGEISIFHDGLDRYYFRLNKLDNIEWNLSNENNPTNHQLKKATANYLGRNWIAWYDESIPLSEGPFLFTGLPGLIVEMHDNQDFFKWKLSSYNLDFDDKKRTRNLIDFGLPKANKINELDFKKIMIDNFYDPGTAFSASGMQIEEEKIKKLIEYKKSQKHRYLIPDLWTYL